MPAYPTFLRKLHYCRRPKANGTTCDRRELHHMGEYPHATSGLISPPLFWMVKEVGIHYQAVTRLGICCCQTAEVDSPASPIKWVVYERGGSFATMRSVIRVCWRASPFLSHAPGQIFSHFRLELVYPCTTITPTPPMSIPLFLNQCFLVKSEFQLNAKQT